MYCRTAAVSSSVNSAHLGHTLIPVCVQRSGSSVNFTGPPYWQMPGSRGVTAHSLAASRRVMLKSASSELANASISTSGWPVLERMAAPVR